MQVYILYLMRTTTQGLNNMLSNKDLTRLDIKSSIYVMKRDLLAMCLLLIYYVHGELVMLDNENLKPLRYFRKQYIHYHWWD